MRTASPYRLRELIGRGASSEVHAAEHALHGDVAVKRLRPELAEDAASIEALIAEGDRLRAIAHPNVVRILEVGRDDGGCYLVMERVRGETLAARLRREVRLSEPEVRRLGAELADGVASAHACGIVHRDLKPANVMLDGARPKIVDFGIAKYLGTRSAVTTGRMIGTLAYMAPEQLTSGMIAPCTDIWALAVILFEALAGRLPFDNFDDGRCPQLFDEPARARAIVPAVSPALDELLARCLAREPSRRPTASELARLLRGELSDERVTADAGAVLPPPPRARRRWGWLVAGGLAVATAVALVVVAQRDSEPLTTPSSPRVVTPQPAPRAEPVIEPDPAPVVEVRSTPVGAEVLVDGTVRGVTPLALDLPLPEVVVVQRAGYRSVKQRVERAGVVDITLHPLPRPARRPPARTRETLD